MLAFFVKVKPMNNPVLNVLDKINETCVLALFYHLLYFTDWCLDADVKYRASYSFLSIVVLQVLVNFLAIIWSNMVKPILIKFNKCYIKRQLAKR